MKQILTPIFLAAVLALAGSGCGTMGGKEEASSPPPPPPAAERQEAVTSSTTTTTTTTTQENTSANVDIDKLPKKKGYPYGIKTNTPGLVKSPYAPDKALVDVSRFQSGNFVRCPHTGKIFVVP